MSDDYIEDFFQGMAQKDLCAWCRHPWKPVATAGLCWHCYSIKRQLRKAERGNNYQDHKIALRKAQLARAEGIQYGDIHRKDISALDLEHELHDLSKRYVNKRLSCVNATSIGWALPPTQRIYVFYLISLLQREYLRKHRHRIAACDASLMSLAEIEELDRL